MKLLQKALFSLSQFFLVTPVLAAGNSTIQQVNLGFPVPTLSVLLSFLIRFFFVAAGLAALLYLLLGAFAWVTSGGQKENVEKARDKIQAAIVGLILIVAVLAIMVTLEQVVFNQKICVGLSCDITIPNLIQ